MIDYDYHILTIVLSALNGEREYNINGGLIQYVSGSDEIKIRLNENSADQIPLTINKGIQAPFTKFFLSSVGTGTIKIYVSSDKDIKFLGDETNINTLSEVAHVTNIDGVDLVTDVGRVKNLPWTTLVTSKITVTDSAVYLFNGELQRMWVHIKNTGISMAFIGYGTLTIGNNCMPVLPGESIKIFYNGNWLKGVCDTGESTVLRVTEERAS